VKKEKKGTREVGLRSKRGGGAKSFDCMGRKEKKGMKGKVTSKNTKE